MSIAKMLSSIISSVLQEKILSLIFHEKEDELKINILQYVDCR